jgi:large-conductance mechanosensitive channel
MGWNAIFVFVFIALCIWFAFMLKKKNADKKIAEKWEHAKDAAKEKVEEIKDKIEDLKK